jgi:hypothetical protein
VIIKAKKYILPLNALWILLFSASFAFSQTTKTLPKHIQHDLTLTSGTYQINGTHLVSKDATLTINADVTLYFTTDARLMINGGLQVIGKPNHLVNFLSKNKAQIGLAGYGVIINGTNNKDINITYARFNFIQNPISFENRWSRNNVIIDHCVFKNSKVSGAAIEVSEIDNLLTLQKIPFQFTNNTFSNNLSGILFSNITSDLLTVTFQNNVLTRNEYIGKRRNGVFTSPLFFTYNQYQNNDTPSIINNSIFDNYNSYKEADIPKLGRTNISVIGNAEKLDLSGNYFGNTKRNAIDASFDFISENYEAPFLFYSNLHSKPNSNLNGHCYEIYINNALLNEVSPPSSPINTIKLIYNKPISTSSSLIVNVVQQNSDTVSPKHDILWNSSRTELIISFKDDQNFANNSSFILIDGLFDNNGMDIPYLELGNRRLEDDVKIQFIAENAVLVEKTNPNPLDTTIKKTAIIPSISLIQHKRNYFDYSVLLGSSIYFGDISRTTIGSSFQNVRPAVGVSLGYQATDQIRFSINNNYQILAGSDLPKNENHNNTRGTNFSRGLSFRTTIIDASLIAEVDLLKFKNIYSYIPSVFAGGNIFYFKPMGQVNGSKEWYDLRSIGTEGQTINNQQGQYSKYLFGIPFGVTVKRHLNQKTVVSLTYCYNKVFTDYLDDVSTGYYPDSLLLVNANPTLGSTAYDLSNPNKLEGQRSYSDDYDGYGFWGIRFTFKIY